VTESERIEEAKRIKEAGEAIEDIFHKYEKATGIDLPYGTYDHIRLLVKEAGEKYLERKYLK